MAENTNGWTCNQCQVFVPWNVTHRHESSNTAVPMSIDAHVHTPVQHRDARPPWCDTCGLTAGFEKPIGRLDKPAAPANGDSPYVIDRENVVWKVVHDGGMATRADYGGITSCGINYLASVKGPLRPFDPAAHGSGCIPREQVERLIEAAEGACMYGDGSALRGLRTAVAAARAAGVGEKP